MLFSYVFSKTHNFQKHRIFKNAGFSKTRDFQKHGIFKNTEKDGVGPLPHIMNVRTIGSHYLSHLWGKETYVFLVEQNHTLAKNGLSNRAKSKERVGT